MKSVLTTLLLCAASTAAMADTYTLVIHTQASIPGINSTFDQIPVKLANMSGTFLVGPFSDLSQCQAFEGSDLTGLFDGVTFNNQPVTISVVNQHCLDSTSIHSRNN